MNGRYRNSPIPLEDITGTIGTMILERAIEWPDHPVFAYREQAGYVPVSWHALLKDVVSFVNFLQTTGIKKRDRVAVLSPNSYAMLVWELAVTSMGAISVPIFAGYDTPHIDYILNHAEPIAIFINGEERLSRFEACSGRPAVKTVVTFHESNYTRFNDCLNGNSSEKFFQLVKKVMPEDVCFIQYTSGSARRTKKTGASPKVPVFYPISPGIIPMVDFSNGLLPCTTVQPFTWRIPWAKISGG
jgi:long-subunit acyl-CoA synthetase (AMP-forming)